METKSKIIKNKNSIFEKLTNFYLKIDRYIYFLIITFVFFLMVSLVYETFLKIYMARVLVLFLSKKQEDMSIIKNFIQIIAITLFFIYLKFTIQFLFIFKRKNNYRIFVKSFLVFIYSLFIIFLILFLFAQIVFVIKSKDTNFVQNNLFLILWLIFSVFYTIFIGNYLFLYSPVKNFFPKKFKSFLKRILFFGILFIFVSIFFVIIFRFSVLSYVWVFESILMFGSYYIFKFMFKKREKNEKKSK